MIRSRPASTALNTCKALQRFYNHPVEPTAMDRDPMRKQSEPVATEKLIPNVSDDQLTRLHDTCRDRRYTAYFQLFVDTGARRTEVANLTTA
ncbi:hypothetical protein [Amycolatopsis jiangsuensis]|uniref:Integrase n=1 Tax=Amycolatopsis jiangsuensis TaxID=1181879 RepID=A0A840IQL3_9PSEU|nr:hypothetical protein [Amycolatopsis jiangsuensis]MBB4683324.1 integrase [Amycolatopsis jiangsuensis]